MIRACGPKPEAHVSPPSRGLSLLTHPRGEVTALDSLFPGRTRPKQRDQHSALAGHTAAERFALSSLTLSLFVPRQLRRGGHNFSSGWDGRG